MIYNASAYESVKDEKIKRLLEFICTNNPGEDPLSNKLAELVKKLKENEKFRSDYAAMNLHNKDLIRNAKKEATFEKAIETAKNALALNLTAEQVSKITGLPLEKVKELAAECSEI